MKKTYKVIKRYVVMLLAIMISLTSIPVYANESAIANKQNGDSIITIDGCQYNAQKFMDRVLENTKVSAPTESMKLRDGKKISFEYNEKDQRVSKNGTSGTVLFIYNEFGNIVKEIKNKENVEYIYTFDNGVDRLSALIYNGQKYHYIYDQEGIITGLCNEDEENICLYEYDKYGVIKCIYEINDNQRIEHRDSSEDNFVGCVNSMRYTGLYYDGEMGLYYLYPSSYYDPANNKVIGPQPQIDIEKLFGDQYDRLKEEHSNSSLRISQMEADNLLYGATLCYQSGLGGDVNNYTNAGSSWYTNFSGELEYYLTARIILGENNYSNNSNSTQDTYLEYNRQGIAWEIINRLLEDKYRYNNNKSLYFSNAGSVPSVYTVLTKPSAFSSLQGSIAKGPMDSNNRVYQQAFWLACCIRVCGNFDQWNVVVPRPAGVTSQCYNKGALTTSSSPGTNWNKVMFPGWTRDYTGASNYSGFAYYSSGIGRFNILHAYSTENLYINSQYYQ